MSTSNGKSTVVTVHEARADGSSSTQAIRLRPSYDAVTVATPTGQPG